MKYLDERLKSPDTWISEGSQKFLFLPSSFFFGLIAPLNFVESVGGATSNSILAINNLDRMLRISEIRL